jgi:hypothetical protein
MTCNYDTDGVVFRDYLQVANDQMDIITFVNDGVCIFVNGLISEAKSVKTALHSWFKVARINYLCIMILITLEMMVVNFGQRKVFLFPDREKIILASMGVNPAPRYSSCQPRHRFYLVVIDLHKETFDLIHK